MLLNIDIKTRKDKPFTLILRRFRKMFSTEQTEELKQYVPNIERRAFGLTRKKFASVCFNHAEKRSEP